MSLCVGPDRWVGKPEPSGTHHKVLGWGFARPHGPNLPPISLGRSPAVTPFNSTGLMVMGALGSAVLGPALR